MALRLGADSGGTFTDVCLFDDADGSMRIWKVPSTPADPSVGILAGITEALSNAGADAAQLSYLGHGTTVGTNALIQGRGVATGLITTDGFRDLIEIGRQKRPDLYDPQADKPELLAARDMRFEVPERIRHDGAVEVPLDEEAVRAAAIALKEAGIEAIAICFLHGYVHTQHERRAKQIVREVYPEAFVSASHEVAPEFREFERMSTTVVNSYLGPVMEGYIHALKAQLQTIGLSRKPHLTQSNGGVIGFDTASELPVRTVLSGPSTGVIAAQHVGDQIGIPNQITFDMGGTSSDVALLLNGRCALTNEAMVHGHPLKAPLLDIHTVGAGGGSIAYVDAGGLLKVGPRSAGANPGPVAYGLGNDEPTVTDANVVLQTLNPEYLLAGRMKIDQSLAIAAVDRLAEKLGLDRYRTAQGILSVVTANMAKAIRVISVQRGHDPRDYALSAFGGAGPLHAARLALELEMKQVVIPQTPGIFCATGILMTDLRADFSRTARMPADASAAPVLEGIFADLTAGAGDWFEVEQIAPVARVIKRSLDMRYRGQNYELQVDVPEGPVSAETVNELKRRFFALHHRQYGFAPEDEQVQIVTMRLEAVGMVPSAHVEPADLEGPDPSAARVGTRDVWLPEADGFVACPLYERAKLRAGNVIEGPAIVEQMDATTVILPGMTGSVEPYGNLILKVTQ